MALVNKTLARSSNDGGTIANCNDGTGGSGTAAVVAGGRAELLSLRRVLLESRDIYSPINVEGQLQAAHDQVGEFGVYICG